MNYYEDNSNRQPIEDYRGGLPVASRVCGIISISLGLLSVTACCLGYLSIPLGALGILFAVLSRRKGKPLPPMCKTGLILSVIGLMIGILMMVVSIYSAITNPNFWAAMQETYAQYQQLYQELYGTAPEAYNNLSL